MPFVGWNFFLAQPECNIISDREMREEHIVLVNHADITSRRGSVCCYLFVGQELFFLTPVYEYYGNCFQKNCFSCTGRAENDEIFSRACDLE